ncbi:DNA-binding SARP family transcriptional activator [Hamadaea flava]|uniref:ATP-binding protein n=1 Tax=Hamadaea flava TaxID=1742688 RepID=A0ABV8M081_9ACTN|nr:AAA family ATPase [Hamadaea flava]MCP2322181.1 DNA-binding SARP family transcriptional activator [Hamadaea flava]
MDLGVPRLRLRLLGGFGTDRPGGPPTVGRWSRPSAQTLVKLLAVTSGHRLHREQVMDVCWPDAEPGAAIRSLRVALHAARHALEPELPPRTPSSYLLGEGDLLWLSPQLVTVDFDEAMAAAEAALTVRPPIAAHLEPAYQSLAEELLPEDRYADWLAPSRAELSVRRRRVILALAEAYRLDGRAQQAVDLLRPLLDQDVTAEDANQAMIGAYLTLGQRRHAVRQYHACRDALAAELGTRPSPATELLYRQALADQTPAAAPASPPALPAQARRSERLPLAGREHAIDRLLHPDGDTPPLVLVSGEAGVGKTRLITEAARRYAARGSLVLWGAGHEVEGHTPYGAWVEALDGYLADRSAAERAATGSQYPELAALLPALGLSPPQSGDPESERGRLFRAVAALLTDLAVRPLLVVLDDLHSADPGSAQLLHHLVRIRGARPWRFLATWREEDLPADDGRRRTLDTMQRQGVAQRMELMRLGRADTDRLVSEAVGRELSPADLDLVYRLSLGNPLYAIELAGQLRAGTLAALAVDGVGVPVAVRHLVADRLARLAPGARRLVEALALAGTDAADADLLDIAGHGLYPPMSGPAVAAGLAEATDAGLIDEREVLSDGRRVPGHGFRHPLNRLACAERLPDVVRRQVHTAYADAVLRRRPDAVDTLVFHLTRADDPRATTYLELAARRSASLYANESAAGYYEQLVERLDVAEGAAAEQRLAWAAVLRRLGRYREAEEVLAVARTALASDNHYGPARTAELALSADITLSRIHVDAGRPQRAVDLVAAKQPSGAVAPAIHAELRLTQALAWFATGRYERSLTSAENTIQQAGRLPGSAGHRLLIRAMVTRSICLALLGRRADADDAARQALPLAQGLGDPALTSTVTAQLSELAGLDGRLIDARDYARQALDLAGQTGDPAQLAFRRGNLGRLCLLAGDWAAGARLLRTALALARPLGTPWCLPYALINLGVELLWREEDDVAEAHLTECRNLVESTGDRQALSDALTLLAEIEIRRNRPHVALDLVGSVRTASADAVRAAAYLAAGEPEQALAAVARRDDHDRVAGVEADRVRALALATLGRTPEAVAVLTTAIAAAEAMPYPYGLTRLLEARAGIVGGPLARRDRARAASLREHLRRGVAEGSQPEH